MRGEEQVLLPSMDPQEAEVDFLMHSSLVPRERWEVDVGSSTNSNLRQNSQQVAVDGFWRHNSPAQEKS